MLVKLVVGTGATEVEDVEAIPFAKLPIGTKERAREADLEDLLSDNVWLVAESDDEGETLLIIGRQVKTSSGKVMDLVAIDYTGALILIEVKRDAADMKARRDNAEIQSIRYAASLATLNSADELVVKIFAPYIERYRDAARKTEGGGRTAVEWARKLLEEFIEQNGIEKSRINHAQKVVLIGAKFDDDTKSAAAWMARNDLPIRVIEVQPCKVGSVYVLDVKQIIPPPRSEEYYVDLTSARSSGRQRQSSKSERASRPRIHALIEAGKIKAEDTIWFKNRPEETAKMTADGRCEFQGKKMSLLAYGKQMSGWGAVNVYDWIKHGPSGKLLGELREEVEAASSKVEEEAEPPPTAESGGA